VQEYAQASMVSEADLHGGLSTSISRTEVEEALALDETPELVLDITGPAGARSIAVAWKRDDLERLLREATGDRIQLTFDRTTIEQALDADDVEAHGLKQKAAVLAVAVATAAGVAGGASAMPMSPGAGGGQPVGLADPTDGGIVNPSTGMRVINEQQATGDSSAFSDVAPAVAVGGAAVLIAGAAFAFGSAGNRRRPATA